MRTLNYLLLASMLFVSAACTESDEPSKSDEKSDVEELEFNPSKSLSIREIMDKYYADDYFFVGMSGNMGQFIPGNEHQDVARRFIADFSYETPENNFKSAQLQPYVSTVWNFTPAQYHIDAARKYDFVIRSHGPISPQCSPWAREQGRTPEELEQLLETYMERLSIELEKSSDVVLWMDVVNETLTGGVQGGGTGYDDKSEGIVYQPTDWFGPRQDDLGWENPWTILGFETLTCNGEPFEIPRYIRKAFEIANEHAPSVKKIYNEHGDMSSVEPWEKIRKAVLALRESGVRVDGIGWQAHVGVGWENQNNGVQHLQDMITWCYENDLEFHITELDVAINGYGEQEMNRALLEATRNEQAATMCSILDVMLKNMGKGAVGVNFWGMKDRGGNGQPTFAALFSENCEPNEAYFRVKEHLLLHKGISE